jgi:ATP-binding cassette, subfamily B (MDR/TAP), member 1
MKQRTTLVIAHRLSTIRNADMIVCLMGGRVVEKGSHAELMAIEGGQYRGLVELQALPGAQAQVDGDAMVILPTKHVRQASASPRSVGSLSRQTSHNFNDVMVTTLEPDKETPPPVESSRLWRLSKPEWKWVMVAVASAIVNGCTFPLYSLLLSTIVSYFYSPDVQTIKEKTNFWSAMFLCLAMGVGLATFVQLYSFTVMGERLTTRLRDMTFTNVLRQDIAWFDREENSTGAITARLATEVTLIKNITGQNLGRMVQNVVTICAAFFIAFYFGSWRMSLILIGILPLLVLGSFLQMRELRKNTDKSQEAVARSGAIAVQAIGGIRYVPSLSSLAAGPTAGLTLEPVCHRQDCDGLRDEQPATGAVLARAGRAGAAGDSRRLAPGADPGLLPVRHAGSLRPALLLRLHACHPREDQVCAGAPLALGLIRACPEPQLKSWTCSFGRCSRVCWP